MLITNTFAGVYCDDQVVGERTYISRSPKWSDALQPVGPKPVAGAWYNSLLLHHNHQQCHHPRIDCDDVAQAGETR